MAIKDQTGEGDSITTGWRALKLFTNRHKAIRHFSSYLNEEPPRETILFFYGDGGNGKSLLLKFLCEHCRKRLRPDRWEYVKTLSDEEFTAHIVKAIDPVPPPTAFLDLGMQPEGDNNPREVVSALLMLQRELVGHGFHFPRFIYAYAWYLYRTHQSIQDKLVRRLPAEEIDLLVALVDHYTEKSWATLVKAALGTLHKKVEERFTLSWLQRYLQSAEVEAIQRMDPRSELIDNLPIQFGEDLNMMMSQDGAPKRIVLFLDTYEAFWGAKERDLAGELYFHRDEWLRQLLATLDYEKGIVAVVAGRECPRWAKATIAEIPNEFVDFHIVGYLSEKDATGYLERAGISDESMRQCLVKYAQVSPDQVHPFYLGLCADVVIAAAKQSLKLVPEEFATIPQVENKGWELIRRLLKYVDEEVRFAVKALSACRAFNREIYLNLGATLNFLATEPAFRILIDFSFVWRANSGGEGRYQIHDLLRRVLRDHDDEVIRSADEVLEKYYRERSEAGESVTIAEAIYHANHLEWERGVREWIKGFDIALESCQYELCRALLTVRTELVVRSDVALGEISLREGNYFSDLSRYNEAKQEYSEVIDACNRIPSGSPDFIKGLKNKGLALTKLGEILNDLAQYVEAVDSYTKACNAYEEVLQQNPDDSEAYSQKSGSLTGLGDSHAELAKYDLAAQNYTHAIAACEEALRRDPNLIDTYNYKAIAISSLGDLQDAQAQYLAATQSYEQAVAVYEEAIKRSPHDIDIRNNKSFALITLAESQVTLTQYEKAVESYAKARNEIEDTLQSAPDSFEAYRMKCRMFSGLGEMQSKLAQDSEAAQTYVQALAAIEEGLQRAPDQIDARRGKGDALRNLGELEAKLEQHTEAIENYNQAISAYDEVLWYAPDDVVAHNNKGYALRGLGDSQAQLGQDAKAKQSYTRAIAACEKALRLAPDDCIFLCNKGYTLKSLGDLQTKLTQYTAASKTYTRAIAACEKALRLAPNYADCHDTKGLVLKGLGDLQVKCEQYAEGVQSYNQAVTVHEEALRCAPRFVDAHNNKASVLRSLGELYVYLAAHSLQTALGDFSSSLEIVSNDSRIRNLRDQVREKINHLAKF